MEASDSNNDGQVNISDGVHILNFLFTGGPEPAPPGPPPNPCGPDTDAPGSPGDLGCASPSGC